MTRTVAANQTDFSAMVPDRLLHTGRNEIEALLIREENGEVRLFRGGR